MISVDGLSQEVQGILDEYNLEVQQVVADSAKKVATRLAKALKASSPKGTGKYAGGWRSKLTGKGGGGVSYTVYNAKKPGLAHLLEHGHAKVTASGKVIGSTAARPHIAAQEQEANKEFEREIRRGLS